jgi:uncharacterized protein YdcH (DUF465 family)
MEAFDKVEIEKFMHRDAKLRTLYEAHREYGRKVIKLERKNYLTESEQAEARRLKKLKLQTKDEIETLIAGLRCTATA